MQRLSGFFVALLLFLGCGPGVKVAGSSPSTSTPIIQDEAAAPERERLSCGPPVGGVESLVGSGRTLLVGEMHGTQEVPRAVGQIACHASLQIDGGVLVALEIPSENQPYVTEYLSGDGALPTRTALLSAPHFAKSMEDGRDSDAILELIESIRLWRSGGASIDVLCYDADVGSFETDTQRDALMARAILLAHSEQPSAMLIVLSGNIHNRTEPGVSWNESYVPMGVLVREALPGTVSLDFRSRGGTFWACMSVVEEDAIRCGVAKASGEDRGPDPFVEVFDTRDAMGFDGVLYVGTTTASPPATRDIN